MSTQVADSLSQIKEEFEKRSGLRDVDAEVKSRSDGDVLILYVAHPTNRLFRVLQDAQGDDVDAKVTIKRRAKLDSLHSAEGRFLLRTLTESLNINRFSFADDFFSRYTKSVSAAEEQITSTANHVVFGRRGSGKSSLLLYAMHTRANAGQPSIWIDMQVYSHRNDNGVAIEVLSEILKEVGRLAPDYPEALIVEAQVEALRQRDPLPDSEIRKVLPMFRRILQRISDSRSLVLFLDDFHAMSPEFQPKLLGFLYSVARGNQVYLKLSAIPTLTRTWDTGRHMGLQIPHDAQTITLDYNLTVPHKAIEHIQSILDAHAQYCGFPSVRALCTSKDVINRLVWVAAGVPRDALSLFANAMSSAASRGSNRVSVTDVNRSASEALSLKLKDLELDADVSGAEERQKLLDAIKDFCVKTVRKNAFLVEIRPHDPSYKHIEELVDLRLLHVINEGITPHEAGRKFLALILDYGFYTGIRAAQSVDLFNRQSTSVSYRELRKLPVFDVSR